MPFDRRRWAPALPGAEELVADVTVSEPQTGLDKAGAPGPVDDDPTDAITGEEGCALRHRDIECEKEPANVALTLRISVVALEGEMPWREDDDLDGSLADDAV